MKARRRLCMPEPLKINFQITLRDWLEFKWQEQSSFRLWLLQLADNSWVLLSVLLAASVLLLSLTLSKIGGISFPAWPPFAILVLLALCRIYLSVPSIKRTRLAKKEWKEKLANVNCTVQLTETGFQYVAGPTTYQPIWTEVASVFQSRSLLMFCDDGEYTLLIPKRAFVSEKQLQEFLEIAYQKTVLERDADGSKSAKQTLAADST
jgi:hypothetical protein